VVITATIPLLECDAQEHNWTAVSLGLSGHSSLYRISIMEVLFHYYHLFSQNFTVRCDSAFCVFRYWARWSTSNYRSSACWGVGGSTLIIVLCWLEPDEDESWVLAIGGGIKIGELGTVGGIIIILLLSLFPVWGIIVGCTKWLVLVNNSWTLLIYWSTWGLPSPWQ